MHLDNRRSAKSLRQTGDENKDNSRLRDIILVNLILQGILGIRCGEFIYQPLGVKE